MGAIVLSIGSELLAGETVDTNAAFLARGLTGLGIELTAVRQLPDDCSVITAAVGDARRAVSLVIATGGLGPTHDDLTRDAVAQALGEELTSDPQLEAMLHERFGGIGRMPSTNLRQAMRIPSAQILANRIGSAPGWWVDRDGVVLALMPGVPSEMRRMFDEELRPRLVARFSPSAPAVRTVKTFGVGESAVAELVGDLLEHPGDGVTAGIYARDDGVHLRFAAGAPGPVDVAVARAREALGGAVWGADGDDLGAVALAACARAGAPTVASWEADTHGALLTILSAVPRADGLAAYAGGLLDAGGAAAAPVADAVIQLSLLPQDAAGRSRVRVSVSGSVMLEPTELRIHGSGDQRLRRAAYAALDLVRRSLGS
ncbi:MAG TPA: molybdopterin-binding protein [Candidatus Limnocylindria bacterium]